LGEKEQTITKQKMSCREQIKAMYTKSLPHHHNGMHARKAVTSRVILFLQRERIVESSTYRHVCQAYIKHLPIQKQIYKKSEKRWFVKTLLVFQNFKYYLTDFELGSKMQKRERKHRGLA